MSAIFYAFHGLTVDELADLESFVEASRSHELLDWNDGELAPRCAVRLSDVRVQDGAVHVCAFIIMDGNPQDAVNQQ